MKTRGARFMVLAVVLFAAAALLMWFGQGEEALSASKRPSVEFPRRLRAEEKTRAQSRRTWVVPTPDARPQGASDPLLAALPRGKGKTAVVLEANALRHSPIGELLLECLYRDGGKQLQQLKERTGIDPLTDLDRLAITDEGLVLSGNFGKAKTDELLGQHGRSSYGDSARIYEPPTERLLADGGVGRGGGPTLATWRNQMVVVSRDRNGARDVIDRVEGRGPQEPPVLSETATYGEVYGVIATRTLAKVLPPDQREIAEQLVRAAGAVELHVDARGDVALVADVKGEDAQSVTDLGKSLGGALALARMRAQSQGQEDVAKLLDFARVLPDGEAFRLEMALPLDVLKEQLAFCREPVPEAAAGDGGVERL
ncbi:hypothetical protein ACN28E_22290 [Archangium lansingense]|uniref:hypothetical protein n=1 Tax=Archangium lansingense TaxID=2995310 RepID=UPI003B7DEC06